MCIQLKFFQETTKVSVIYGINQSAIFCIYLAMKLIEYNGKSVNQHLVDTAPVSIELRTSYLNKRP